MKIRFINFDVFDAFTNMSIDESISQFVIKSSVLPTFRIYGWDKPSISIGEFQKIDELNSDFCLKEGIPIVRRPTGGKGILHYNDITYSLSAKKEGIFKGNLFTSYAIIGDILTNAFRLSGLNVESKKDKRSNNRTPLCFARSSFGEIIFNNQKIVGSAQKRWRDGFLQQGTIPIEVDRNLLKMIFFVEEAENIYGIREIFRDFKPDFFINNLKISFKRSGFEIVEDYLLDEEIALAQELTEKYRNPQRLFGASLLV